MNTKRPNLTEAIRMFKQTHPEYRSIDPDIDVVIAWLLGRTWLPYIQFTKKRMAKIDHLLDSIGTIDIDKTYPISGKWLLELRVNSKEPFPMNLIEEQK